MKISKPTKSFMATIAAIVTIVCSSQATTLTFDDLPFPDALGIAQAIPTGYGGFNWNNGVAVSDVAGQGAAYYNTNLFSAGGYTAGVVSGEQAALSWFTHDIIMSGGLFDLTSAYITAAWNTHDFTVEGYLLGSLTHSVTYSAVYAQANLFTFNFNGVDEVRFKSGNGSLSHIVLDDITVNGSAVPDTGATIAMLGGAMLGLAALRRRFAA